MNSQRYRIIFSITLILLDALMIITAFVCAYWLRVYIDFPDELASLVPPEHIQV